MEMNDNKTHQQAQGTEPEEVTVEFQGKIRGDLGEKDWNCGKRSAASAGGSAGGGAVYGLGFIGAAVYYISTAASFGAGVLGFLKAIVWPAFLVFGLLKHLGL